MVKSSGEKLANAFEFYKKEKISGLQLNHIVIGKLKLPHTCDLS